MTFYGPDAADLDNVFSLNAMLLELVRQNAARINDAEPLADALRTLAPGARRRLAETPFLLMSVAEHDLPRWQRLLAPVQTRALPFAPADSHNARARLCAATTCFLWQLARANPYAARVVSGASLPWCEQLANATLVDVLNAAAAEPDLLSLRFCGRTAFWQKLLAAGSSEQAEVRVAARMSALQTLLTHNGGEAPGSLRRAACALPDNALEVAEDIR